MAYETFLFDLDGTLIDSVALIVATHHHTRRVHYGASVSDREIIATMGRPLLDVYGELAGPDGDTDALIATYRAWNDVNHDRMVRAYAGVLHMLRELTGRGARLAVVTSKSNAGARRGLSVCGLADHFDVIVGADDVARGKPGPEPVWRALSALGADAGGAVMVGDSTHDMEAGRRAGVATAAVLWGPFERAQLEPTTPDHWLSCAADVLAL